MGSIVAYFREVDWLVLHEEVRALALLVASEAHHPHRLIVPWVPVGSLPRFQGTLNRGIAFSPCILKGNLCELPTIRGLDDHDRRLPLVTRFRLQPIRTTVFDGALEMTGSRETHHAPTHPWIQD